MTTFLPLVGVIVGGLLTFAGGFVAEQLRWSRAQSVRWDERRQVAYAEYAAAVKAETVAYMKIANKKDLLPSRKPGHPELEELVRLLTEAEKVRTERFEIVQLVGSPAVVDAAREWQSSVWSIGSILEPEFTGGRAGYEVLYNAAGTARQAFYRRARGDLGVAGELSSPPPIAAWLERWGTNRVAD